MNLPAIPRHVMKAATVQFQHINADKEANLSIIEKYVEEAKTQNVELIAFPECCISGYWGIRNFTKEKLTALAEFVPGGESTKRIIALANEHQISIGAGLFEKDDAGNVYNTYIAALPDGSVHRHRKLHAFVSPHLTCGNEYTVFTLPNGWKAGVLICYDNNIIENARNTVLLGADVLLAPHQTGGTNSRSPHGLKTIDVSLWQNRKHDPEAVENAFRGSNGREWLMRWLPSRAHDNGMFLLFSNGVGQDDDEIRTGNAMMLDPYGRIITETWKARDEMLTAELDPTLLDNCTGRRWMRARRPDLYQPIATPMGIETDIHTARYGE